MEKLKHLSALIDPSRPASFADLSQLKPAPNSPDVIFVIGCPRSGTTALGNVLGANDLCVSGDESLFLLSSWMDFDELVLSNNRRHAPLLASYTSPEKALTYYTEFAHHFYRDLLSQKSTARYAVDHTPWHAHIFEFLDLLFPNAKYVHIVRDEASTVDSLRRIYESGASWGQEDDESRKALWKLMTQEAYAIKDKAPGRYFEIPYDSFASNPEKSLEPFLLSIHSTWQHSMSQAAEQRYAQPTQAII